MKAPERGKTSFSYFFGGSSSLRLPLIILKGDLPNRSRLNRDKQQPAAGTIFEGKIITPIPDAVKGQHLWGAASIHVSSWKEGFI